MSYSVFRIQGIKTTGDLKGISKHNKDRVSHTNQEIDKTRSKDNITLVQCSNYSKEFNKIVDPMKAEHNERMKTMRSDRVKTFDQHINSSQNDVACEMIFTSDNEFFDGMSKDDIRNWAEKSLDFVTKDIGIARKNILHAIVHMDERTPHLHVVAVPLVQTYNKKQKKDVWSISRRQYISGKQQLSSMQDIYNKRMNDSGYSLERGEKGSERVHITKAEYEKQQLDSIKQEINKAQNELIKAKNSKEDMKDHINTLERSLKALEGDYKAYRDIRSTIVGIDNIEVRKNRISRTVSLKQDDYDKITGLAKQGVYNSNKIEDLERKNKQLESTNSHNGSKNKELWDENLKLKSKVSDLNKIVKNINKALGLLSEEIRDKVIGEYEKIKNPVKEVRIKNNDIER